MRPELIRLLIASCFCLAGLGAGSVALVRDRRRTAQRGARIDSVAQSYRQSHAVLATAAGGLGLSRKSDATTLASRAALLLRYDPDHRAIHPAAPWVVMTLAAIPSAVMAYFVANFVGPAGWATVPILWALLCRGFYGWFEDRLVATLFQQFPDALAMIVRAVRVGLPIVEAIRVVARENAEPTAREFAGLVAQTTIGVPLDDALREMAERNRLPEYRFFATALSLQSQTGGGLTETLENLADTIRKRVAAKLRGHALAAEARMSSYILGALPLVAGAMLSVVNPGYMAVLFTDPSGRTLLLIATAMLLGGAFIMRTMIRKSLT
jgi:tight adherence protein B